MKKHSCIPAVVARPNEAAFIASCIKPLMKKQDSTAQVLMTAL